MKIASNTEWLFFHLWKKNPYTLNPCEGLHVIDTIVYRWAQPHVWYYTTKEGEIARKSKERITSKDIEEKFMANVPSCGVTASYITPKEDLFEQKETEKLQFEYIRAAEFPEFINQDDKSLNCIIQQFIEPKNNHSTMFKVVWTPRFCLMTKKTNIHALDNQKIPLVNRIATFEGPEHFSISESVASPLIAGELEAICNRMVTHIGTVTGGNIQISKMVIYFKIDPQNQLWLLYCTELKFRDKVVGIGKDPALESLFPVKKTQGRKSPVMTIREFERKKPKKAHHKMKAIYHIENEMQTPDTSKCFNCDKAHELELYDIKLQYILQFYEDNPTYNSGQTLIQIFKGNYRTDASESDLPRDARIPAVMYKLYPLLKYEKYLELKEDNEHMELVVHVCEDCYLRFTLVLINDKGVLKVREKQKQHIQKLMKEKDPNSLKNRLAQVFSHTKLPDEDRPTQLQTPHSKKVNKSNHSSATLNQTSSARLRNTIQMKTASNERLDAENKKPELRAGLSIFSSFITSHVNDNEENATHEIKENEKMQSPQREVRTFSHFRDQKDSTRQLGSKTKQQTHSVLKSGEIKIEDNSEKKTDDQHEEADKAVSKTSLEHDPTHRTLTEFQNIDNSKSARKELEILSPKAALSTEESGRGEGYTSAVNLKLLKREVKPFTTTNAYHRARTGNKTAFFFRGTEEKGTSRDFRILTRGSRLSKKQPEQIHRNNYSGISTTIKDLRSFLVDNSLELDI